jgi:hypothetical protein
MSCQSGEAYKCSERSIKRLGGFHGIQGMADLSKKVIEKCPNPKYKRIYKSSYIEQLSLFCSKDRGMFQAQLGLELEEICVEHPNYTSGYMDFLKSRCSKQQALDDVRSQLSSSNNLCKKINAYKAHYFRELKKNCTYSKGKQIGLQTKSIENICLDSSSLKSFKRGYKRGLSIAYQKKNRTISKKLLSLRSDRTEIKNRLTQVSDRDTKISLKIELNKLESQILSLQSELESNKAFIH